MKKSLLIAAASLMLAAPAAAQTYAESASTTLYSFANYEDMALLKYFRELNENGKIFPTSAEFKAKFGVDVELVRSHVRKRDVLRGAENPYLFPNLREGRTVFLNLPMGTEKGTGGFPSGQFDNDPFTLWQYTDLHGAWNHGFFQAPGSWADAAHKHGVDMMSGIKFFDTTGNPGGVGSENYQSQILLTNADGSYVYTKPLIHLLMYLGLDGINYNWEATGYTNDNVVNFHKSLRDYAIEKGFTNYRQAIYTSQSSLSNSYANAWLWDAAKGRHIGDIMLNYSGGDFATSWAASSGSLAQSLTGSYDHLYNGGWIVTMNRDFAGMEANQNNLCLWGEHANSRFVSNNSGDTGAEKMKNLQYLYERAFSGGNRNAGLLQPWASSDWGDKLANFGGISRMIPERTTIKQNLPFVTYFNTGAGERYFYRGKSASKGGWYNMASQDIQPTYRWLQYRLGTKDAVVPVQVEYSYEDAFTGGSSLRFNGEGNVDVILYRGLITIGQDNPVAKLAFKAVRETNKTNGLSLLLHKKGEPATTYHEFKFQDLSGKAWEEQTVNLSTLKKGDVIDFIGIRMAEKTQDIYLGGISLFDDRLEDFAPKAPTDLHAEVKMETPRSLSVMLSWNAQAIESKGRTRAQQGLLYNDEAGVHHFEILYRDGDNGAIRELGRTTSWIAYVPTVDFKEDGEAGVEQPQFGVRAVGEDLKTMSEITWISVTREPSYLLPQTDRYCKTALNPQADGADVARRIRYLERVSTTGAETDLNYVATGPDSDGDNYVYHKTSNLVVKQGKTINFTFKAFGDNVAQGSPTRDGLQWCWAATYIDWNNDGVFDATGDEKIKELALGTARRATPQFQTTGVTKSFMIPTDATPGQKVRVRVIFTDAWFPEPTPCASTAKGFSFDFDMMIVGDNPGRPSTDLHDAGDPEPPVQPTAPGAADEVFTSNNYSRVFPNPAVNVLNFENADHAWIFTLDGVLVRYVADASTTVDVSALPAGTYIIKTEKDRVTRSHKVVKK